MIIVKLNNHTYYFLFFKTSHNSIFGDYLDTCREFVSSSPTFTINFVNLVVNSMAHKIARTSQFHENL